MSSKEIFSTKLLSSLANEVNINMQINKHILETIQIYQNQINDIKQLLKINKDKDKDYNDNKESNNDAIINQYIDKLKNLKNNLNQEKQKISEKNKNCKKKLSENTTMKQSLEKEELDNFILKNTLLKLNDEISRYNKLIKTSREHSIFREIKRDTDVENKIGDSIIYESSLELGRNMLLENRYFNKCVNKIKRYQRKIKKSNKKIEKLKYYIEMFKKIINKMPLLKKFDSSTNIFEGIDNVQKEKIIDASNNKNKKFQEDDNNFKFNNKISRKIYQKKHIAKEHNNNSDNDNDDDDNYNQENNRKHITTYSIINFNNNKLSLLNDYDNDEKEEENKNENESDNNKENINKKNLSKSIIYYKNNKKKNSKKIELLSLDELFDLSNYEGEKEEIIDDELHSNDETKFEKKVIPPKKIINDYLKQIKTEVPSLNLSQIEFNKAKVINEADLYSLQRRNFEVNDIDCVINNMKKKIKKLKKKLAINKKKYEAMRNFIEETKENYNKILRPLKTKSSVENAKIEFHIKNLIGKNKNKNNKNIMEENQKTIEEENVGEESVGSSYSDEDKYMDEKENDAYLKVNEIKIIGDGDDDVDNAVDKKNNVKTQIDIKTDIGLNLNLDKNANKNGKIKKYIKKKNRIKEEDDSKYNSK
jgi:hypothetical protein